MYTLLSIEQSQEEEVEQEKMVESWRIRKWMHNVYL